MAPDRHLGFSKPKQTMDFNKVLFCVFAVAILLNTCHGLETQYMYGTSGVLTNFMDNSSSVTNATTWIVKAPVDHGIDVTVFHYGKLTQDRCHQLKAYQLEGSTLSTLIDNCNHTVVGNINVLMFISKKRFLNVTILESSTPFFAIFEAKEIDATPPNCRAGWTKAQGFCYKSNGNHENYPSDADSILQDGATAMIVDDRNSNYLARALLLTNYPSSEYLWINVTTTVFTAWHTTQLTPPNCAVVDHLGIWHAVPNCEKHSTALTCRTKLHGISSTFHDTCKDGLGLEDVNIISMAASSELTASSPINVRLKDPNSGWISSISDANPWISGNFKKITTITAIATQGIEHRGWITSFQLCFKRYPNKEVELIKLFQGNSDENNVEYNVVEPMIKVRNIKLYPKKWEKQIALRMELYGCRSKCYTVSLGLENGAIPNSWMKNSTNTPPQNARLHFDVRNTNNAGVVAGISGWSPTTTDIYQWIQVDFGSRTANISAILTQGRGDHGVDHWVTKYVVSYSYNHTIGFYTGKDGKVKIFDGNHDRNTVKKNELDPAIYCNYIRLHPSEWNEKIALRLDFNGCMCKKYEAPIFPCASPMGMKSKLIPDAAITSSSYLNNEERYKPYNGRLFSRGWRPSRGENQWLQVDFGMPVNITGIATQGEVTTSCYTDKYEIKYSTDNVTFHEFSISGNPFVFYGNQDANSVVRMPFYNNTVIHARYVRVVKLSAKYCVGVRVEFYGCGFTGQPNGNLSQWSEWSECNNTCNGTKYRNRTCHSPSSYYKAQCPGELFQQTNCNRISYCDDFTEWTSWTRCSKTCGLGESTRISYYIANRTKTNCTGSITIVQDCNHGDCPSVSFGMWTAWSECNMTCGLGVKERWRNCTVLKPNGTCDNATTHEAFACNRTATDSRISITWGQWSRLSECRETCSQYSQNRTRTGTSGENIKKYIIEIEAIKCHPDPCDPCVCKSSNWTECSATCGNTTQSRYRNCSLTSSGALNCSGATVETRQCNLTLCPVDGNFTLWTQWSGCTRTCGNGTQMRMRNCTNPPPANGGANCSGSLNETQMCNPQLCPIDGNFTAWGHWSRCTRPCGNGTQTRMRNCTHPPPANGGANCSGPFNETQHCKPRPCPIHGNFTLWNHWSGCTRTCGNGTQTRKRNCTNPSPANGGDNCSGPYNETQICNQQPCPNLKVDGNWTTWNNWTTCTLTCGGGTQKRMRTCTNPPPAKGGANCTGNSTETQSCQTNHCPIDGNWTNWSGWSYCNRPCGTGHEIRTRTCTKPAPMYGGKDCVGSTNESTTCNTNICPDAEVRLVVRFTEETWSNNLANLNSSESTILKQKILKNVKKLYQDQSTVIDIDVHSFRNGSVITNFTISFKKMDSTQLIVLQESIQTQGLLGEMPLKENNITTTRVPKSGPSITHIENITSTSINVTWTRISSLRELNGKNLTGYSVFYRERTQAYTSNKLKAVRSHLTSTIITGIEKYTDYSLRIVAFTVSGNGVPSDAVDFKTDEDVPSVSPPDFKVQPVSSTSMVTAWKPIEQRFVHGILLRYNMTITNLRSRVTWKETHGKAQRTSQLKRLHKFTKYSVEICGVTSKGCGVRAEQTVMTMQDTPSLAPQNPKAFNLTSVSEIQLSWAPVPADSINGILGGYILQYRLHKQTNTRAYEPKVIVKRLSHSSRNYKLTGLESFSVYEFKIAARTRVGVGPYATFYGETCRCPKYINTNYWFLTPYLNLTASGKVKGIFSHIVTDMITWACADCTNGHGKTVVEFGKDGKGSSASKNSMLDVIGAMDNEHQVSFPINGNKYLDKIYGGKPFIPVIQSPGVAFLIVSEPLGTPGWNILKSTTNAIPFILFSLMVCYLTGIVIWYLDSGSKGSIFPKRFTKGVYEGFWWSFITMTTVGYGDRVPLSKFSSRLFAIFWTLYSTVLLSIFTSTISNSLTTVTLQSHTQIYGVQIAAIQNSSEHRIGILKNGKVNQVQQYHTLTDIYDALVNREVKGALVDVYVVAAEAKKFSNHGIRVSKILDRPFGYGVALSIGLAPLESECREYLKLKAESIYRLIDRSTEKLTVPSVSSSNSKSTNLFNPKSKLFHNSLLFVGCMLCLAVMCGLVWHYTCHRKNTLKVSPQIALKMDENKKNIAQMKRAVKMFRDNFAFKLKEMHAQHQIVRLKVYVRERERERKRMKREKAEQKAEESREEFHLTDLIKLVSNHRI